MDSAGVEILEVWSTVSFGAITALFIGGLCFLVTLMALAQAFEKDDFNYMVTFGVFFVATIICVVIGITNAHQRGFKAKVDNMNAFSQISMNYTMLDLDENGVFTFKER